MDKRKSFELLYIGICHCVFLAFVAYASLDLLSPKTSPLWGDSAWLSVTFYVAYGMAAFGLVLNSLYELWTLWDRRTRLLEEQ